MGQVFLGVSPSGRRVAVKLIHPVHAGTEHFRERFAREIEAARRVGGFHTAPVVDADPHAETPWMVTAYIDGPSLEEGISRYGPLWSRVRHLQTYDLVARRRAGSGATRAVRTGVLAKSRELAWRRFGFEEAVDGR